MSMNILTVFSYRVHVKWANKVICGIIENTKRVFSIYLAWVLHRSHQLFHTLFFFCKLLKIQFCFPAGKTTILYKFKFNEHISSIPTIGFNVETVTPVKGLEFTVWDVGGQEKIRRLWKNYFTNADGECWQIYFFKYDILKCCYFLFEVSWSKASNQSYNIIALSASYYNTKAWSKLAFFL